VATHLSARKRARQAEKRRIRNRHVRSRVKGMVKAVHTALETRAPEVAELTRQAESVVRKAASKGVLTRKQASRRISRLARRAHKIAAAKS
jgi:small subunit ribosomal protein S20